MPLLNSRESKFHFYNKGAPKMPPYPKHQPEVSASKNQGWYEPEKGAHHETLPALSHSLPAHANSTA